ncbi:DNA helicase RecQ [Methylocapsa palsarum]|uniref:DNA helicase RecQ n=1 Tax=Methylocapsa palsarum TaxID=1612308 RepID=A0A1I3WD26_9HYPH|nr:DNA helicase RecQ [Methylocapsa palsarum]SFK04381.1 ATP-dependent DNA helicase RecQ [Methylocapsa palsarum]
MHPDTIEARAALERVFGFADFRPGQIEVLDAVFSGENVLAVMPTGSGKSLCYQLPAIVRKGLTIVVSPLIALMRDQVQQLERRGVAAAALHSANTGPENAAIEAGLRRGRYRLVYVAPERLLRPDTPALLREAGANALAIDEAHCVSQWGHDFRPEYHGLAQAAQAIGGLQLIAVTATADAPTRAEIVRTLFSSPPRIFVRSFDRPNIHLSMRRKTSAARQVEDMVARHKGQSGIVYCASRKGAEDLSRRLSAIGAPALPYHAGLAAEIRSAHQDEFLRCDGVVIVATVAFGMGIDKPDVRFVCHADLPQSVEAYYQEIGRAGRDGLPAKTLTLFSDGDIRLRERQIAEGDASAERKRAEQRKLQALIALCESPRCRRQTLLAAFGEASDPCGNCDICEGHWPVFNGVVAAQKIMSAIHRTSGRFFSGHLANLLVGKATDAIKRHGHDLLPTFGVGKEFAVSEWRSMFHQLHASELIAQDPEDRDRWVFTDAGRDVILGQTPLTLRGEIAPADARAATGPGSSAARTDASPAPLTARQHKLLAALKAKRLEIARAQKTPAFVILHDSALIEIAIARPRTPEDLQRIHGVGPAKASRYGAMFLAIVQAHSEAS